MGVKTAVVEEVAPLALEYGLRYTGGHPMAGLEKAGYGRSFPDLFQGASMVLTPTAATAEGDIEELSGLFRQVGFQRIEVCGPQAHDRMIAHTSQLGHVVSNCYVKSPASRRCLGFAGGSYRDMTRVACLNEAVWAELFLMNREALLSEIDQLISAMDQTRQAIAAGDRAGPGGAAAPGPGVQGGNRPAGNPLTEVCRRSQDGISTIGGCDSACILWILCLQADIAEQSLHQNEPGGNWK